MDPPPPISAAYILLYIYTPPRWAGGKAYDFGRVFIIIRVVGRSGGRSNDIVKWILSVGRKNLSDESYLSVDWICQMIRRLNLSNDTSIESVKWYCLMLFLIWDILFFRGCEGLLIRRELNIPGIIKRQCPKFDTNENIKFLELLLNLSIDSKC